MSSKNLNTKGIVFLAFCVFAVMSVNAQKKAVTEYGEQVILYDDKTWDYTDRNYEKSIEIPLNKKEFKKPSESTFFLKSSKLNVGFWLDSDKWNFKKSGEESDAEYEVNLKGEDAYCQIITENIEISLPSLKLIAIGNAREVAPDIKIVKEEYRMVNGLKVLMMQMDGTTQGIKFSYYSYYYSSPEGIIQFITYTSTNLLKKYINEFEDLLNGIEKF